MKEGLAAVILYRVHEVGISYGLYERAKPSSKSLRVVCTRHDLTLSIHSHKVSLALQAGCDSSISTHAYKTDQGIAALTRSTIYTFRNVRNRKQF